MNTLIISAILVVIIYLLVTEKIPVDLTGVGIMVVLVITGILTPEESVRGFAHPAVITVGAMFIISKGMMRTGVVAFIGQQVIRVSRGNLYVALILILITVAVSSAFINNTPVVVLFIPVVMTFCCEFGLSPSQFLIPVSYASILAGTCTLIGTSTNIIVSDLSAAAGYGSLSMFELSILGIPIAVLGIIFLLFASPRLMPSLRNPTCQFNDSEHRRYIAEVRIPSGSKLEGCDPSQVFSEKYPDLEVLELIRKSHIYHPDRDQTNIAEGDLILLKGSLNELVEILHHEAVELPLSEKGLSFGVDKDDTVVVELIILPQSTFLGQRLMETPLMSDPDIHVIAIKRNVLHFTEKQIYDVKLKNGDMILVWCKAAKLETMRAEAETDFIIVEDVYEELIHKRKSWFAVSIFLGFVVAASSGWADIMICALVASLLMVFTGCIQMRDAYKSLQGGVLLLIAGTIALGTAMEKTGTSRLYADALLSILVNSSPKVLLGGIILITSLSTQILSNSATAVLIFPIAASSALGLGVDPKPFIVGVCFGASACFATPIGYQTNLLVYGPGGYRFSDYLKMGIPLNALVLTLGVVFIPVIWPF